MSDINNEYQRGADDIWSALQTLKENDYDIEEWLEDNSPSDTFLEVVKLKAVEEAKGYGLRVSIDDINCTPPTEVYKDPLKKRMSYNIPMPVKSLIILNEYGDLKVGYEAFDTLQKEYAIIHAIYFNRINDKGTVALTNGYSFWTTDINNIIPTNTGLKSLEDFHEDRIRRERHDIQWGDVVKILKVPSGCEDIEVGSYRVIDDNVENEYYIYDDNGKKWKFTAKMIELMV